MTHYYSSKSAFDLFIDFCISQRGLFFLHCADHTIDPQVYLTSFISPPCYPLSIKVMRVMLAALDTLSLFTAAVAALVARLVSDAADG